MAYEVTTAVFEGPLDLLLQLITRRQVDIIALSLVDLVGDYLASIEEMRKLDLEVTSEFLLIAATLIQLKARHLLPGHAEIDTDEDLDLVEERDRLVARLLQCVTFKDVAAVIAYRLAGAGRHMARQGGIDQEVRPAAPDLVVNVEPLRLAAVAGQVLARFERTVDLDHLDLDLPSVEAALEDVKARIDEVALTTFGSLVENCRRPVEVIAYFLALLELARWGLIEITQEDWLSEISVRRREGESRSELVSEWRR